MNEKVAEETLDPQNWTELRTLGHQMLDDMLDYLEGVRQRPVWQPIPAEVKDHLSQPVPHAPQGEAQTYQDFKEHILPHPLGNIHPRFWGWVIGTGTPFSVLAEMLAATMNPNLGGGDHVPNYVEYQVIDWCKEMMGFPADASGLLVSGGSMANLTGLTVARNAKAGFDIRQEGVNAAPRPLTLYGSVEMHSSLTKSAEMLGLGNAALRKIPVNAEFQIDIPALEQAIAEDKKAGFQPFCIIGNAGTVNTGAFDDLDTLAAICQREQLWFHVDGAFGALAALPDSLRHLVRGMSKADSLAFDLHKWMYMPIEVGCVLVRRESDHTAAFAINPDYLAHMPRGAAGGSIAWFNDLGMQLSRGFRALKVWMSLKAHGLDKFARLVEQNVAQAQHLAGLVENTPELELVAPVPLNIVCFRVKAAGLDDTALNDLNKEILMRLHESGVAVPSYTTIAGKFALRAAITNHRSTRADFDLMVEKVLSIAAQVLAGN